VSAIRFVEPGFLWLLSLPAIFLVALAYQLLRRRQTVRRLRGQRTVPVHEHFTFAGSLSFWFMVVVASALVVVALARPQVLMSVTQSAGVDVVVLQDGSTSMRVTDVNPDRWQRSVAWLRTFAEVLSWRQERVALALFAHRTAPQVRLTSDPNALFFFLDHLGEESPFRLQDDTSWDTNIEDGLYWGVKMIDKDEELYGRRLSAKAFIVLSDGQSWSGEVERALALAQSRNIRVYVVGVGTTSGGFIPQLPPRRYQEPEPPIHSVLDRQSLRAIAQAGGGAYYELGAESDQVVALKILADIQRASRGILQRQEDFAELYWYFLIVAAVLLGWGTLLLKEQTQLWWQLATAVVVVVALLP
jgi:Ca-activated chloride channel family protein